MNILESLPDKYTIVIRSTLRIFRDWIEDYLWSTGIQQAGMPIQAEMYGSEIILFYINPLHGLTQFKITHLGNGRLNIGIQNVTGKHNTPGVMWVLDTSPDSKEYLRNIYSIVQERWHQPQCPYEFHKLTQDRDLEEILISHWTESIITYNAEAYLSTIVLLGSILEGALLAKIFSNAQQAGKAKSAPKDKTGQVLSFERWGLDQLIDVAYECRWIGHEVKAFSKEIRNYRNLIHPRELQKQQIRPTKDLCDVARVAVESALKSLTNS